MRKVLWLASALTLLLAPAALAEPAPAAADLGLFPEGGCAPNASLADPSGSIGLEELGLFALQAQPMLSPPCPQPMLCPTPCPAGHLCGVQNLGPCCTKPDGNEICCFPPGTLQVITCPCKGCPGASEVRMACV